MKFIKGILMVIAGLVCFPFYMIISYQEKGNNVWKAILFPFALVYLIIMSPLFFLMKMIRLAEDVVVEQLSVLDSAKVTTSHEKNMEKIARDALEHTKKTIAGLKEKT